MTSIPLRWDLESLTIGPMYRKADAAFWGVALNDFPRLPHSTKVKIIYHHCMPAHNTSCWASFGSILANRKVFPRFGVVDVCTTYRSQLPGYRHSDFMRSALGFLQSSGVRVTYRGKYVSVFLCSFPGIILTFVLSSKPWRGTGFY